MAILATQLVIFDEQIQTLSTLRNSMIAMKVEPGVPPQAMALAAAMESAAGLIQL